VAIWIILCSNFSGFGLLKTSCPKILISSFFPSPVCPASENGNNYIEDIAVKRMQKVIGATVKKDGELLESLDFDAGGISKSVGWQGGGEFIYYNSL
jgi:hypothetical protein